MRDRSRTFPARPVIIIARWLPLASAVAVLSSSGCRRTVADPGPGSSELDAGQAPGGEAVDDAGGADAVATRTVEARAEEARRARDAVRIDPRCAGVALALDEVLSEPRCVADGAPWAEEGSVPAGEAGVRARDGGSASGRPGGGAAPLLRQEARRPDPAEDPWGVTFVITNLTKGSGRGAAGANASVEAGANDDEKSRGAVVVPVRVQLGPGAAPPVSVLAESDAHAVYELEAPKVRLPEAVAPLPTAAGNGGAGTGPRSALPRPGPLPIEGPSPDGGARLAGSVRSAWLRLAPSGSLRVRLVIDPRIVRRLDRPCTADAADCAGPLPRGRYTLHIGQLFTPLDAGPPAALVVDVR